MTLDQEMREVLAQLELCSHVPATGWGGGSGHSSETLGGGRPPGDTGATPFARAYGRPFFEPTWKHPGAQTDVQRRRIIEHARGELKHLRGHSERPAARGETLRERDARIVHDGEGFTAKEVALRFRCGARDVQRARVAAGREPALGKLPAAEASTAARRQRARALFGDGMTVSQIARLLDCSRPTVERDLGRAA